MKPIQVGLLGVGVVGSGTFNVLKRNQQEIQRRAGRGIEITMVADLDTERARAAVAKISVPWTASSALLAVTTCLPAPF
jgi:homoserine dehydrogenase